jgi:hypothetical protein
VRAPQPANASALNAPGGLFLVSDYSERRNSGA